LAGGDFQARGAAIARFAVYGGSAVERFGKEAGEGGFANTTGTAEQVGMGDRGALEGISQSLQNRLLPNDFGKTLGSVASG
jgi:hypothetical protein